MKKTPAKKKTEELQVVYYGTPCLRRQAARITKVSEGLKDLAQAMLALMHKKEGVGLAATQVGIEKQIAVVDLGEGPLVLINPRFLKTEGEEVRVEGCLSLPGLYGEVTRATKVVVEAMDLTGKKRQIKAEGFFARALQHEIDHLNGKLFIDRVDESTLHWAVRSSTETKNGKPIEAEPLCTPTTLQDALRVFRARTGK